jgi:hypothetical protein
MHCESTFFAVYSFEYCVSKKHTVNREIQWSWVLSRNDYDHYCVVFQAVLMRQFILMGVVHKYQSVSQSEQTSK